MSNEELVSKIQQGDTGAIGALWDNVCLLVRKMAVRFHRATDGRGGLEVEDLEQVGFLAMVNATETYNPEKEAKFSTWLCIYLRKYFQEASGRLYQTTNGRLMPRDALDTSVSLNLVLGDDEDTELMEITEDPTASLDSVDDLIWHEQLRKAVSDVMRELPEDQTAVMRCRFWENLTQEEAGRQLGYDAGAVRRAEDKALRTLGQSRYRKKLLPFYDFSCYSGTGLGAFKNSGASIQERYVMKRERINENMF